MAVGIIFVLLEVLLIIVGMLKPRMLYVRNLTPVLQSRYKMSVSIIQKLSRSTYM